ncbi:MAG: CatB-related O-acetyltransferase [Bacteroidetes bacterium]|nr:CatB-related O-acetyltransferase [Bacteroidota bacterium]
MTLIKYFKNFFRNTLGLLKVAAKNDYVFWNQLGSSRVNCDIDPQTKFTGVHSLENVSVQKGTYIAFNANISNTSIGKFCSIGPNFFCGWGIHPVNGISTSPAFYSTRKQAGFTFSTTDKCIERKNITIGNDVFIGMNVTVLDGVTIGDGAVIGAGAVVSKDIPPYAIAVGSPIQIVKYRFSQEKIDALLAIRWWDQNDDTLRMVEQNFFEIDKFIEGRNGK